MNLASQIDAWLERLDESYALIGFPSAFQVLISIFQARSSSKLVNWKRVLSPDSVGGKMQPKISCKWNRTKKVNDEWCAALSDAESQDEENLRRMQLTKKLLVFTRGATKLYTLSLETIHMKSTTITFPYSKALEIG